MINLLADFGNSRIKIAETRNNKLHKKWSESYNKSNIKYTFRKISSSYRSNYNKIYISCPVINIRKEVKKLFTTKYPDSSVELVKIRKELPIKFKYKSILGSDRICSALGAKFKYPHKNELLIIDFGTATTLNFLSNNTYLGGLIACGPKTQIQALKYFTSLPDVNLKKPYNKICQDTNSAIKSAAFFQTKYFCESIITYMRKKHRNLFVIATGGYSKIFYNNIDAIDIIESDLVLLGMNYYSQII